MSQRQMTSEIDQMLIGMEVQDAVNLTVDYILRDQKFLHGKESAYGYWSGLSDDEKSQVLLRALRKR